MKFEKFAIAQEIKDNLLDQKYFRTTDIQFKAIPPILNGEDVLAIAQTGSGKTAAFAIPIIHQIHTFKTSKKSYGIKCLVLVPTRELAQQIGKVFAKLSKRTKANSFAIYGGVEQEQQIEQIEGGVDILIATPGRMFDLIHQKVIDICKVSTLVLDEADHMLDLGFIDDIKSVKKKLLQRHQTLFFSATINPKIKKLAYSQISSKALRIQVSPENMVSKNVSHTLVKVEMNDKRGLLLNLIKDNPELKIMIFMRTQVRVDRFSEFLKAHNVDVLPMHGGMEQDEREKSLARFRKASSGCLIATDVTARGIDLPQIHLVINVDLPDEPENYVHRVGRTGRGFDKGEAISFCASEESQKLKDIESFLEVSIPVMKVGQEQTVPSALHNESLSFAEMIAIEEANHVQRKKVKKKTK